MRNSIKQIGIALVILASNGTASALEHFASNAKGVENSQCRYPVVTSIKAIEKYFENKEAQSEKGNFETLGFKFVDESPFYVKHFKDLIEPTDTTIDDLPASIQTAQRSCSSVRCALEKIFGKSESLKALYLLDKYRFNVAPMKYYGSGYFKDRDLDIILETMALVPPHLLPLSDLQQLSLIHI